MASPAGIRSKSYSEYLAVIRTRTQWGLFIAGILILFTLPLYMPRELLYLANLIGITIVAVQGLNILLGYCGQISLGHAAFMMVGAYVSAWLNIYFGLPIWVALPIAGISAGAVGLIFGTPSLRIKGFYLAMSTLAAQFIIPWCIRNINPSWTGGYSILRLPATTLGPITFRTEASMFYIIMPITVLAVYFTKNIGRTRAGRAFVAIRDSDLAAEVTGIPVFRYKLLAFFISAIYAGVAGCLWAYWYRNIHYSHFELDQSIWFLGMLVIGGLGSVTGACMGVIVFRGLDYYLPLVTPQLSTCLTAMGVHSSIAANIAVSSKPLLFGLIILLFIIFEPRGLYHLWERFKLYYRLWPFAY